MLGHSDTKLGCLYKYNQYIKPQQSLALDCNLLSSLHSYWLLSSEGFLAPCFSVQLSCWYSNEQYWRASKLCPWTWSAQAVTYNCSITFWSWYLVQVSLGLATVLVFGVVLRTVPSLLTEGAVWGWWACRGTEKRGRMDPNTPSHQRETKL